MSEFATNPFTKAADLGLDVVLPGPRELQIDIDDEFNLAQYEAALPVLREHISAIETKRTVSMNGGTHIYVTLGVKEPLTTEQRIAFQCALGSDSKRELLSIMQVIQGSEYPPCLMFEVPDQESDEIAF